MKSLNWDPTEALFRSHCLFRFCLYTDCTVKLTCIVLTLLNLKILIQI